MYTLDGDRPVPVGRDTASVRRWARWFGDFKNRQLRTTEFTGVTVSTVFLGIDSAPWSSGPPVLWETMVFMPDAEDALNRTSERYTSAAAARRGHATTVARVAAVLARRAEENRTKA